MDERHSGKVRRGRQSTRMELEGQVDAAVRQLVASVLAAGEEIKASLRREADELLEATRQQLRAELERERSAILEEAHARAAEILAAAEAARDALHDEVRAKASALAQVDAQLPQAPGDGRSPDVTVPPNAAVDAALWADEAPVVLAEADRPALELAVDDDAPRAAALLAASAPRPADGNGRQPEAGGADHPQAGAEALVSDDGADDVRPAASPGAAGEPTTAAGAVREPSPDEPSAAAHAPADFMLVRSKKPAPLDEWTRPVLEPFDGVVATPTSDPEARIGDKLPRPAGPHPHHVSPPVVGSAATASAAPSSASQESVDVAEPSPPSQEAAKVVGAHPVELAFAGVLGRRQAVALHRSVWILADQDAVELREFTEGVLILRLRAVDLEDLAELVLARAPVPLRLTGCEDRRATFEVVGAE